LAGISKGYFYKRKGNSGSAPPGKKEKGRALPDTALF
jgi:hypothetical protein